MITLTLAAIVLLAVLAHFAGRRATAERPRLLARVLDGRAVSGVVFVTTFFVLWYSWASLNPIPVVHDEMAYVLQAQIFARGLWALPSQPFPEFWEQAHVLVEPAVAAKYFPGHALLVSLGALVGWLPLMPLVLQSGSAVLMFVLARRLASHGVACLTWIVWLFTPMVLYFGPSYFSEATTTFCWLAGWYALLQWRATGRRRWLLAVALFTGWDVITRPLTGLAYAIPIGVVVLHDVVAGRRWRDLAWALVVGTAILAILPVWSAKTTGDWRVTPLGLYTRMYMPYDVPGFGLITTPPSHAVTPELAQLNATYRAVHVNHFPSTLLATLGERAHYLRISVWGVSSGILSVFAILGVFTLNAESGFSVGTGLFLLLVYLVFATPAPWTLYYYESVPAYAYLSAAGMAWAAAWIGRPGASRMSATFSWRSPRWTGALLASGLVFALPGAVALRLIHAQHVSDRKYLVRFGTLLQSIRDHRAVVFVRHAPTHDEHVTFVRNSAYPVDERVWVVYDRGETENARLLDFAPDRKAYLFDEVQGRTYLYDPHSVP